MPPFEFSSASGAPWPERPSHWDLARSATNREQSLPLGANIVNLLGVTYAHLATQDGGDLYLTAYGVPFCDHLQPENWHSREWFEQKRERLLGTATVYKVPTRWIHGVSLSLVVKWSRVGEDVPLDTFTINKFVNTEFNSPFEEFALVMEMRAGEYGPSNVRILAQKPLGIYVPAQRLLLWQTGRSEDKIRNKLQQHPGVELDMLRQYIVIYGWIKGHDLVQTADLLKLKSPTREEFLQNYTQQAIQALEIKGYRVMDMKPAHVIVRPKPDGSLLRNHRGETAYAVVDYELMTRTPEHEMAVRGQHRRLYLEHMVAPRPRPAASPLPAHLKPVNLLGVDYLYGRAESTGGRLCVAGRDPELFDYFLPERWRRTPHIRLSCGNLIFCTRTKDQILLVWKVSRLGELPPQSDASPRAQAIRAQGFNNPFEEFACATELARSGIPTVRPRAIYITSAQPETQSKCSDLRHYLDFRHWRMPDQESMLDPGREYMTLWGYWNGPEELFTTPTGPNHRPINAEWACNLKLISEELLADICQHMLAGLAQAGYEVPGLKPDHILLSRTPDNQWVTDPSGRPEGRLCNFELVRKRPLPAP